MPDWVELMGKDIRILRLREPNNPNGIIADVGTIVQCNIRGYYYSVLKDQRLNSEPFETLQNQFYQIGEGDCIPGLELPLRHSRVGEVFRCCVSSRFAYGSYGRCVSKLEQVHAQSQSEADFISIIFRGSTAIIPPNTDLEYEVEILGHLDDRSLHPSTIANHQSKIDIIQSDEERHRYLHRLLTIQLMQYRKDAGNRWFSYDEFPRAAKAYSSATKLAESYFNVANSHPNFDETNSIEDKVRAIEANEKAKSEPIAQEDVDVVSIYVACLNNLAACKVSLGEYSMAKDLCVKVLQFSPYNAKALLRAARSCLALDEFRECELCLQQLFRVNNLEDTYSTAGKIEAAKLRRAKADYKAKEKAMQKKIASKIFSQNNPRTSLASLPVNQVEKIVDPSESSSVHSEISPEVAPVNSDNTTQKPSSNNMILLLVTSFAVIVVSLIIAFTRRQ